MVLWGHPSLHFNAYLDWFSRFAWLPSVTDRQTDRQTDHANPSVAVYSDVAYKQERSERSWWRTGPWNDNSSLLTQCRCRSAFTSDVGLETLADRQTNKQTDRPLTVTTWRLRTVTSDTANSVHWCHCTKRTRHCTVVYLSSMVSVIPRTSSKLTSKSSGVMLETRLWRSSCSCRVRIRDS